MIDEITVRTIKKRSNSKDFPLEVLSTNKGTEPINCTVEFELPGMPVNTNPGYLFVPSVMREKPLHTERKMLLHLLNDLHIKNRMFNSNSTGKIFIYSERKFCGSCADILDEFQNYLKKYIKSNNILGIKFLAIDSVGSQIGN
jgi:hypothetical protein